MKRFFTKKVIIILLVALFIAITTAVTVSVSDTANTALGNAASTVTAPVKKLMASMVDSLERLYDYLYKYELLETENQELKERIAELESEEREFEKLDEENQQLRDLLELGKRNEDYLFEAVSVISWSASNYESSFTISKGKNDGLELNDCVITGSGYLIGQITELSSNSATVTTVIDPDTSLGAIIYDISELAMAEGDFQLMQDGMLKLTYLDESSKVVEGYTVTTSGRSGTYPVGLVIGTVSSVKMDLQGLNSYAVIEPAADLNQLSMVYVITDFGISE